MKKRAPNLHNAIPKNAFSLRSHLHGMLAQHAGKMSFRLKHFAFLSNECVTQNALTLTTSMCNFFGFNGVMECKISFWIQQCTTEPPLVCYAELRCAFLLLLLLFVLVSYLFFQMTKIAFQLQTNPAANIIIAILCVADAVLIISFYKQRQTHTHTKLANRERSWRMRNTTFECMLQCTNFCSIFPRV